MKLRLRLIIFLLLIATLAACVAETSTVPAQVQEPDPTQTVAAPGMAGATLPTPSPAAFVSPLQPNVLDFRVAPTETTHLGETIAVEWRAEGDSAELCWLDGRGPTTCAPVDLAGETTLTVDEAALKKTGVALRVTSGDEFIYAIADLAMQCHGLRDWFFDDPPVRCPSADAQFSPAAAQVFEGGMMIWTETPDTFYVFFDEPAQARGKIFLRISEPYDFDPEQPLVDAPPDGLLAPVSGFGKLWRGELSGSRDDEIRSRLGWATGPEFAFESALQCETQSHPRGWACYLQAPDGRVLRLQPDSTAQVNLLWWEYVAPE